MSGCATPTPSTEAVAVQTVAENNFNDHSRDLSTSTVISADNNVQISRPVSSEDVIGWSIRGIGDDVIIDRIEHSPTIFHLSASEEIHLRDAGVSNEVVRAMKATAS